MILNIAIKLKSLIKLPFEYALYKMINYAKQDVKDYMPKRYLVGGSADFGSLAYEYKNIFYNQFQNKISEADLV